jgi:hypothetical protein
MHAFQIAAAGDVPDDNWTTFGCRGRRSVAATIAQVIHGLGDITVKAGEVDHDRVSTHRGISVAPPILRKA